MGKGPKVGQDIFTGAGNLATSFGNTAQGWLNSAKAPFQSAVDFWSGMAQGGKGAQNLVAPSAMQINRTYRGADRALQNFMPAGGERNLARAQASGERARSIADLYANVQPYAYSQLADLSGKAAGIGTSVGSVGTQGFGQLEDYQGQRNQAKGAALGGIGSGLGALGGGFAARCWIAEVLYGVNDNRTWTIRRWLGWAPLSWQWRVFRFVYDRIGQPTALLLRAVPVLQAIVRPLFDRAYRRAHRWTER